MTLFHRGLLLAVAFLFVSGCSSMKPQDFADREPRLVIEDYFQGRTRAWGIFEDRFGDLRREFTVDIDGTWDGKQLVLDEHFDYADGEKQRRVWTITKIDDHTYEGTAGDILGKATGKAYGNALNWRYDMLLNISGTDWKVHFNDWMYLQPDGVLVNRARVSKWGLEIGEVTLMFKPVEAEETTEMIVPEVAE